MGSVLQADEEDIKAAWEIVHGTRDDERRNIKKSSSGDYVGKLDKEHSVETIPEGQEFPDTPKLLWIADAELLQRVSEQRDIELPPV